MGISQLYVNLYSVGETQLVESLWDNHSGLGIGWSLPGGLDKIEFVTRARNRADALKRRGEHHQYGVVVYDQGYFVVAHGYVRAVETDGLHVLYTAKGPWDEHNDQFYTTVPTPTDTIPEFMQDLLSAKASSVVVDPDNFAANTTVIDQFGLKETEKGPGLRPGEAIKRLLDMSNTSYETYVYYTQPRQFRGMLPQLDYAVYAKRPEGQKADFTIRGRDLVPGNEGIEENIFKLATSIKVRAYYLIGTHDGGDNSMHLFDETNCPFLEYGVQPGDMVTNTTTGESGGAGGFSADGCEIAMRLSGAGTWDTGDGYSIRLSAPIKYELPQTVTANYRTVELPVEGVELNQNQALQLANRLANEFSNPVLQRNITIGGRYITNAAGVKVPPWRLFRKPYWVRIIDAHDSGAAFDTSIDNRYGMYIQSMDYEHESRTMSITPNTESDRLDELLNRAGIVTGRVIESGGRPGGKSGQSGQGNWWEPYMYHGDWRQSYHEYGEWLAGGGSFGKGIPNRIRYDPAYDEVA